MYNLAVYQTLSAPTVASSPYTVTHNLNTTTPFVQIWDAVTGNLVEAQVHVLDANHVQISVATNMPNNVNVVVMGVGQAPAPNVASDWVNKAYVDARTPNLPPPINSGSGIQSFTDVLGDVWIAANGVYNGNWKRARDVLCSRVYRAAGFSAWPTTQAVYGWDTVSFDPYSFYTMGGSTWTIPVTGRYRIYAQAPGIATAVGQQGTLYLYNGATVICEGWSAAGSTTNWTLASLLDEELLTAGSQLLIKFAAAAAWTAAVGNWAAFCVFEYMGTG
jgi:hypothetical protein